ncbi:MAG: glycosyltransferase family 2 protein [Ferrovum sp.]|nr:glycosyltransferase family 2 protein [Ferrovum sp.]NDU87180.1 glycosyltransferase family 2 protein [Ferrovum sp.]
MIPSTTHVVLIPSFNTGDKLFATVREARRQWNPVYVVVDGSTDGSGEILLEMAVVDDGLQVLILSTNRGKGAAVMFGLGKAQGAGFTHVLTMDADGQHPSERIIDFMRVSESHPDAMILGYPQFDTSAPMIRVRGRKISNWWANFETLQAGIGDSLFGFRVYPVGPLLRVMCQQRWMRRFDFDPEAVVRLCWDGVRPINLDAPVKYFSQEEGGVSHFNYLRDNALLTFMHIRLLLGFVLRLPALIKGRRNGRKEVPLSH